MPLVVADAGPLCYLVLIECVGLLPRLFGRLAVPIEVQQELLHSGAPPSVRDWASHSYPWLVIGPPASSHEVSGRYRGEQAVIALAATLRADLVLMDDRAGVKAARGVGLAVIGTIGLLDIAGDRRLIDLSASVERLRATNFRCSPKLLDALIARHEPARRLPSREES